MKHTTHTQHRRHLAHAPQPAGFTLVEMLVAVTLVILMLMLFAQIFGDTVRIMREQQALSQNDQKARGVETILRNDFARMTTRQPRVKGVTGLVPLRAGWPIDPDRQRGYFYISENDLENAGDDVIQFTIDGRQTHRAPGVQMYKGRAAALAANEFSPGAPPVNQPGLDVNQPDWDDGAFGDNLGESHAAEVVYFLRGGNLYRRQLLLREPIAPIDPDPSDTVYPPSEFDPQPGPGPFGAVVTGGMTPQLYTRKFVRNLAGNWIPGDYLADLDVSLTPGAADFWNDFDYSAWNWWRDGDNNGLIDDFSLGTDQYWLMFNGADSLKNVPGATPFPIALPPHRFGHRPPLSASVTPADRLFEGQPVEYLLTPTGALAASVTKMDAYIGRYTHEETSHPAFGYPGVVPPDQAGVVRNPMMHNAPTPSPYNANWDVINNNSIIDAYEGGPRAGEDLILSGVESFDIEVWDDGYEEPDLNGNGVLDPFEDRNGDGVWQRNEDINHNGVLNVGEDLNGNGLLDNYGARWVNLGHPGWHPGTTTPTQRGFYSHAANRNPVYGPRPIVLAASTPDGQPGIQGFDDDGVGGGDSAGELGWPYSDDPWNRVFDTWHPNAATGVSSTQTTNSTAVYEPPFHPLRVQLSAGVRWAASSPATYNTIIFPGNEDRNYNNVLEPGEDGEDLNDDGILDPPNMVLDPGEDFDGNGVLDPGDDGEDLDGDTILDLPNGVMEPIEDRNGNGILDGPEDRNGNGTIDRDLSYYYRPVLVAEDLDGDHIWDTTPTDEDADGSMALDGLTNALKEPEWPREPGATVVDGGVVWQCFDNRVGLQMVRLTIRYRDPASGAPRQVSIVHSFVE